MDKNILLFLTILIISNFNFNAEANDQFDLPNLPTMEIDSINNEKEVLDEKIRKPSNSINQENPEYTKPDEEVQQWDYQKIIDRHDKR